MKHQNLSTKPVIELSGVSFSYGRRPVLDGINLKIRDGQFAGIVGPNGTGKTTLLKLMLGIIAPTGGDVLVFGERVRGNAPPGIGYVPQLEAVDWDFPVTVEQAVMMGRHREMGILPWASPRDKIAVGQRLERLGISEYAREQIRNLSGGERQRVFLARALVCNPSILLLDEPTSGIDLKTQHDILHLLEEINAAGITILISTHDLNAIAAHLPHVICFNKGVVAAGHPDEVFTPAVLRETYGSEMTVIRHGSVCVVVNRALAAKSHDEYDEG
ncbi:MAG: metal ABC transporter ATP-binding protein [Deltaproteobacteria bacterium]